MAAYVDHEYYFSVYGGTKVQVSDFTRREIIARTYLDWYTFNRVKYKLELDPEYSVPDEIKNCMCMLMDYLKTYEDNGNAVIASETVSKHSISYATKSSDEEIRGIVNRFLGGTPWTYRGSGAGP